MQGFRFYERKKPSNSLYPYTTATTTSAINNHIIEAKADIERKRKLTKKVQNCSSRNLKKCFPLANLGC